MSKKSFKSVFGKTVYVPGRMTSIRFKRKLEDGSAIYETEDEDEIKALGKAEDIEEVTGGKTTGTPDKVPTKAEIVKELKALGFESGKDYASNATKPQLEELLTKAQAGEVEPVPAEDDTPPQDEPPENADPQDPEGEGEGGTSEGEPEQTGEPEGQPEGEQPNAQG